MPQSSEIELQTIYVCVRLYEARLHGQGQQERLCVYACECGCVCLRVCSTRDHVQPLHKRRFKYRNSKHRISSRGRK